MDRWVYIHIQFIIWSFYLFTLHLSRKDHMVMKILLFVWFFIIGFYIDRRLIPDPARRVFIIVFTYALIFLGHDLFQYVLKWG